MRSVLATDALLGGRYRLGSIIGSGGVADVYRADDVVSGEAVAVKVLRNLTGSDLRRFELEARALERLRHRAIVRLRDVGEQDGSPFIVLDLVEGDPLSQVLHDSALDESEVTSMGSSLASALAHAHELGIVHRDVKPGNVLVDRGRAVYLTDFGIARLVGSSTVTTVTSLTDPGLVIGTAAYLAPEQVRGDSVGPKADVYSLGLVLLEAITGERAFAGPPVASALARLEHQPNIPPLTPWLASLLSAMTSSAPSERPSAVAVEATMENHTNAGDQTAVLPVLDQPTASIAVVPPREPPPDPMESPVAPPLEPQRRTAATARRRWLGAMCVLAVVVVLLLVALARSGGSTSPPVGADTTTTTATVPAVVPSTVPSTAAPSATTARTPPAPAPKPPPRKGEKGKGPGGDNG